MGTKKPAKKRKKKKSVVVDCPNPGNDGRPYTLTEFLTVLKNKEFALSFLALLKQAGENNKGAIDCVNSYLEPTVQELEDLGIPAAQIEPMRKCTDSGLLVWVTAQQNSV